MTSISDIVLKVDFASKGVEFWTWGELDVENLSGEILIVILKEWHQITK